MHQLKDGDYLRIGNGIYRFLAGGNIEAEYHEEIYRLTIIDALTEIHNKRYCIEFLGRSCPARPAIAGRLSLVMFDIDRFKAINDQPGPSGRRLHPPRTGRAASSNRFARKTCSPATAAKSLPWSCRRPSAKMRPRRRTPPSAG